MGYLLKLGQTTRPLLFLMIDSADHVSAKTGLSPTVTLSKNGAAFGSPAGAVTEIANGWYKVAGNATDTGTVGPLLLHASSAGADPTDQPFEVVSFDPEDAVRLGLSALPNAAAEAAGGLYTRGSGAGQINQPANGRVDANAIALSGTTLTARDIGASVLLSAGTGTGQLDFTSGVVKANLAQILGTALTETAGLLAGGFKQLFNVATPTGTLNSLPNAVPGAAGGLFIAGSNAATSVNLTGNLSGSVGSVTTVSDKTGYALSTTGVQAIWDALTSALTTVGSVGKRVADNLDATVSTRSSHTAADVWTSGTRTLSAFGFSVDLSGTALATIWDRLLTAITTTGSIGKLIKDNLDAKVSSVGGSAPTAATVAAAVWDEAIGGHLTAGSTGSKLNSAGGAGGAGSITFTYTVYESDGVTPLDGCEVYVTTDLAGSVVVAGTLTTDAFGVVVFQLDAGTFYFWRKKSGWNFLNPDVEAVS